VYDVLLISKEGDGLGVAHRLSQEGCRVKAWVRDPKMGRALEGIIDRIDDWVPHLDSADLVITDSVGLGRFETQLKASGRPLLGCSSVLDKVELSRGLGMRLFDTAGIATPETYEFNSCAAADHLIQSQPWRSGWVLKPDGNKSASKTMVIKEEAHWPESLSKLSPDSSGIVQRRLDGIEVSTEGWFNGTQFVPPFNHTFEEKRFLAGGLGQNTGCMGNVVLAADQRGNALTHATVARLSGFLQQVGYRGPLDINCIVNEEGAFALEATSRMGYDAVEALAEGLTVPLSDFLYGIATGSAKECPLTDQTMIAVRVSVPPWPVRQPDGDSHGELVEGIDDETLPHLFLTDVYRDNEGYKTAAGDGVLLKATAKGPARRLEDDQLQDDYTYYCRSRVYRLLEKIKVSSKQYRIDIGQRVNKDMAKLKSLGWLE